MKNHLLNWKTLFGWNNPYHYTVPLHVSWIWVWDFNTVEKKRLLYSNGKKGGMRLLYCTYKCSMFSHVFFSSLWFPMSITVHIFSVENCKSFPPPIYCSVLSSLEKISCISLFLPWNMFCPSLKYCQSSTAHSAKCHFIFMFTN